MLPVVKAGEHGPDAIGIVLVDDDRDRIRVRFVRTAPYLARFLG